MKPVEIFDNLMQQCKEIVSGKEMIKMIKLPL